MPATLSRSTLGRLLAFATTGRLVTGVNQAFSASDWAGFSATGTVTPSVNVNGALVATVSVGSGQRGLRFTPTAPGEDVFVIVRRSFQTTGGAPGAAARVKAASPAADLVQCSAPLAFAGNYGVYEIAASAVVQSDLTAANRSRTAASEHALWVRGTTATSRQLSSGSVGPADATNEITGLGAGTDGESVAIYTGSGGSNVFTFDGFLAMRSAILRVTGPNSGTWQVRLRDASGTLIYTSASHTGGVVEINTLTELTVLYDAGDRPLMAQIEIYEPATVSVVVGPEVPSERLWGGDEWAWAEPPTTPTGLTVDLEEETSVTLSWDAVSGATSYKIFRSATEVGGYSEIDEVAVAAFVDTGLTPGTTYWYRVQACNSAGCSADTAAVSATTLADAPAAPPPPTVTSTSATRARVIWEEVVGATGYQLEIATDELGPYTEVPLPDPLVLATGLRDLTPETTYWFRLRYFDAEPALSDPSTPVSAVTLPLPADLPAAEPTDTLRRVDPTGRWRRREPLPAEVFRQPLATEALEVLLTEDDVWIETES